AVVRQLDALAAAVVRGALAGDEPLLLEAGEEAAEVAGVEAERAAQVGGVGGAVAAELEEDAGLGQRMGGGEQSVAQRADASGVEAVEGADGLDLVGVGGHRSR